MCVCVCSVQASGWAVHQRCASWQRSVEVCLAHVRGSWTNCKSLNGITASCFRSGRSRRYECDITSRDSPTKQGRYGSSYRPRALDPVTIAIGIAESAGSLLLANSR